MARTFLMESRAPSVGLNAAGATPKAILARADGQPQSLWSPSCSRLVGHPINGATGQLLLIEPVSLLAGPSIRVPVQVAALLLVVFSIVTCSPAQF